MTLDERPDVADETLAPREAPDEPLAAPTPATAKKTTAKKAPAKKTTAKKAPAKKSPVKKAAAKKAPAKKTATKKAPAKKSTAPKAAARTTPADKTAVTLSATDTLEHTTAPRESTTEHNAGSGAVSDPETPRTGTGGDDAAPPPPTERRGGRGMPWGLVAGRLVIVLLAAAVGYLMVQLNDARDEVAKQEATAETEQEVLERARELAVILTTYDYRNLDGQQRQLEQASTEAFIQKFAETNKTLGPMFTQLQASAKGTVIDAAVKKVEGDLATALVLVDQSASSTQSKNPTTQASRLRMNLVRQGDLWLLDSVDLL